LRQILGSGRLAARLDWDVPRVDLRRLTLIESETGDLARATLD
jgi:hypothetical protein